MVLVFQTKGFGRHRGYSKYFSSELSALFSLAGATPYNGISFPSAIGAENLCASSQLNTWAVLFLVPGMNPLSYQSISAQIASKYQHLPSLLPPSIPDSICTKRSHLFSFRHWTLEEVTESSLNSYNADVHSCVSSPEQSEEQKLLRYLLVPSWKPKVFTPAGQDCMNNSVWPLLCKSSIRNSLLLLCASLNSLDLSSLHQVIHYTVNTMQDGKSVLAVTHFKEESTRVQFP